MSEVSKLITTLNDEGTTTEEAHNIVEALSELPIKAEGLTKTDTVLLFKVLLDPYSPLKNAHRVKIVRNFIYPKEPIPNEVVIGICGSFGVKTSNNAEKRISTTLQVYLIKWLVSVYSFLKDSTIVDKLYGLLFNYLEFEYLRPHIAHILFLSTKKIHINKQRVDRLRNLRSKFDESEHIIALLILYKEFVPDQIFDIFPNISHTIFSHPNYPYLQELINLNKSNDKRVLQATNDELQQVEIFGQKLKKRKKLSSRIDASTTATTDNHIHTVSELVKDIEKLKIPADVEKVISDKSDTSLLLFIAHAEEKEYRKLNTWLKFTLEDLYELPSSEQLTLLENVRSFVERTNRLPITLIESLVGLLDAKEATDSTDVKDHIWYFITKLPSNQSSRLAPTLKSLMKSNSIGDLDSRINLLNSTTLLLLTWVKDLINQSSSDVSQVYGDILNVCTIIKHQLPDWLIEFDSNLNLIFHILKFININKDIPKSHQNIENVVLPPNLTYMLLFSNHPYVVSEICGYLNFTKYFLQEADSNNLTIKLTALHNSYVVDLCNALWRNRAFHIPNKKKGETSFGLESDFINTLSVKVPIFDRNSTFPSLFNISHSPAFASKTAKLLRELEDEDPECTSRHAGPLTNGSTIEIQSDPDSKWLKTTYEDTKIEILKKMDKEDCYTGLADLLFSHLKSLLGKRN